MFIDQNIFSGFLFGIFPFSLIISVEIPFRDGLQRFGPFINKMKIGLCVLLSSV